MLITKTEGSHIKYYMGFDSSKAQPAWTGMKHNAMRLSYEQAKVVQHQLGLLNIKCEMENEDEAYNRSHS